MLKNTRPHRQWFFGFIFWIVWELIQYPGLLTGNTVVVQFSEDVKSKKLTENTTSSFEFHN